MSRRCARPAIDAGADVIAEELPGSSRQYFAAYLAPGDRRAPILRARIDSVTLGVGGQRERPVQHARWIISKARASSSARGGRLVATYPITSSVIAHPDLDRRHGQSARRG